MACFLGCFGFSSKRKYRKPANKVLPGDHKLVSYEPLDSPVSRNPIDSNSQLSDKPKNRSSLRIGKKVSFNLNVQAYEPIPAEETTTDEFLETGEKGLKQGDEAEKGKASHFSREDSNSVQRGSYPNNYRYKNCIESYDDEDELAYEESDDDNDDDDYADDDYADDDDVGDQGTNQEELLDQFDSLPEESSKEVTLRNLDEEKIRNTEPPCESRDGEKKLLGSGNARIRSQYISSVLNPVENISQWKAVKARAAQSPKYLRKENVALDKETQIPISSKPNSDYSPFNPVPNYYQSKPLLQDVAVDVSLSKWIASS
ncbi:hypothetical protein SLEP1_g29406 [Rubroshorea leprosula]|uniref:Uncharacterized protein n=1 Tax=Rubroshorea leprosula TaxID=152421 RepID=A0AAV5K7H7_9ROSI|nr:hypothetical protein SLEP1_g29406 [Rubroshorea leprosula]